MPKKELSVDQMKKLLEEDTKKREEGFAKELTELKKKWGIEQNVEIGNNIVQNILEAFSKSKVTIQSKSIK